MRRGCGETFQLGDTVEVRLVEAIPSAGALRFEMMSEGSKGRITAPRAGPVGKLRDKRWRGRGR